MIIKTAKSLMSPSMLYIWGVLMICNKTIRLTLALTSFSFTLFLEVRQCQVKSDTLASRLELLAAPNLKQKKQRQADKEHMGSWHIICLWTLKKNPEFRLKFRWMHMWKCIFLVLLLFIIYCKFCTISFILFHEFLMNRRFRRIIKEHLFVI